MATNGQSGTRAPAADHPGNPFAALPPVAQVAALARDAGSRLAEPVLVRVVQDALARERAGIVAGGRPGRADIEARVLSAVADLERPRLTAAINATGVIVHTNLGRAAVSAETAAAMAAAAANAVPLELDPGSNERGGRMREVSDLVSALTGAEAALAVNNCAAALVLTLSALAAGREVVVSRGEAVEIGGGFRIPDVMRQGGATLVEVGTTNRTYAADYAAAATERTAMFLKVHASNFRIVGFTHAPPLAELVAVARPLSVAVVEDLGSGALLDTRPFGLAAEPLLEDSIAAGADAALISGDKLLGGPQAGIIAGRREVVAAVARHPLARAVRADKTALAGLAATLRHYARGEALTAIPVWRAIAASADGLRERARALAAALAATGVAATADTAVATVGGGSLPGETLPSWAVAVAADAIPRGSLDAFARRLRTGTPGVHGRIEHDRLLLDLRTVMPEDDERLLGAVRAALAG
jgi:L-seryl-tRNA(Ser) seleniumtransferase